MKFRLVKLKRLTGDSATVYSVIINDDKTTLFDRFISENLSAFPKEIHYLNYTLYAMGHSVGAREDFFKPFEGNLGDGVSALYDKPKSKLRLYCIRYGACAIILGGGGYKPKKIHAYQEDKKLDKENEYLCWLSALIMEALRNGDVKWSSDGSELIGDLTFTDNNINE